MIDEWKEGSWVYEIVHPPIRRGRNDLNNDMPKEFREPPAPGKQKTCAYPDYFQQTSEAEGSSKQNFNKIGTNLFDLDDDDSDDVRIYSNF